MPMRLSGLVSGMDTESIIEQLVMAKRTKVDDAKKAQKKLQWTQEAWKTLNSKIKKLYDGTLSNLRFESSYLKKTTKVSNSNVVSVITGDGAMNSVQSLKVKQMAKSGYLTGGKLGDGKKGYTADTRLSALGYDFSDKGSIKVTVGGEEKTIEVTGATTIGEFVSSLKDAGVNASFDATNQRFYVAAKDTGVENDFSISAGNLNGLSMLEDLGLCYENDAAIAQYQSIIDNKDNAAAERLPGRLESRLAQLTARQAELADQKSGLMDQIKDLAATTYASEFAGVDMSDPAAVKAKVDALVASEAGKPEEGKQYGELATWSSSLSENEAAASDVAGRLQEGVDGAMELTEAEKQEVEQTVKQEAETEAEEAGKMISRIRDAAAASGASKTAASDAVIELNGVEYTGSKNTFEINGLTLTVNATTAENETVTITTQDDTDGIYDMIKNFFKEYNELINEMDKLYNADSARGYEPLTDEEKDAMSDTEVEEWEKKIKDALLRRDDTLGTVSNAMKELMLQGVSVNGKMMYLSDFGIETLSYFTAAENEHNAYHIDGDPDDTSTSGKTDKLKSMIANDPQTVIDFFVGLSRNLYSEIGDKMKKTEYSSSFTVYEDVKMQKEYDDYTAKIKDLEKKLADYEDKWYAKFADMETAMSKLQSNASAVTALLGG